LVLLLLLEPAFAHFQHQIDNAIGIVDHPGELFVESLIAQKRISGANARNLEFIRDYDSRHDVTERQSIHITPWSYKS
jgi:hypothetical protein